MWTGKLKLPGTLSCLVTLAEVAYQKSRFEHRVLLVSSGSRDEGKKEREDGGSGGFSPGFSSEAIGSYGVCVKLGGEVGVRPGVGEAG